MTDTQAAFLNLVRCALLPKEEAPCPAYADWPALLKLACQAKMDAILYSTVAAARGDGAPPAELLALWQKVALVHTAWQQVHHYVFSQLLDAFQEQAVPCIVIKGPVLAALYPQPECRYSIDADLLVPPAQQEAAFRILSEQGFATVQPASGAKTNLSVWVHPKGAQVDLHLRLWEDYNDDRIEELEKMNLTAPDTLVTLPMFATRGVTLGHTEHLIYQMYHLVKHISYKGIHLRNMVDTALFVNRYLDEIDLKRFWQAMERIRYDAFCAAFFQACAVYFGMNPAACRPGSAEAPPADTGAFMEKLLLLCMQNPEDKQTENAALALYEFFVTERKRSPNRFNFWRAMIFPARSVLSPRYQYARDNPVLLPIAWIHRLGRFLFRRDRQDGGGSSMKGDFAAAESKFEFLKDYQLL